MTRLTDVHATANEMIVDLSDGVYGVWEAMKLVSSSAGTIDPDAALMGEFGVLLSIDMSEIYGGKFYKLYNNLCQKDLVATHACIRSIQLGLVSKADIHEAIDGKKPLDVKDVMAKVRARLPDFAKDIPSVFDDGIKLLKPRGLSGGPS